MHIISQKSVFDIMSHRHVHPAGVPMDNGTIAEKAFALAIAGSGLVAFALTVALIQQVGGLAYARTYCSAVERNVSA